MADPKKLPPRRAEKPNANSRASYWREARRHLKRALTLADEDLPIDCLREDYMAELVHRSFFRDGNQYSKQTRLRYLQDLKSLFLALARARKRDQAWVAEIIGKFDSALKTHPGPRRGKPKIATLEEIRTIYSGLRERYTESGRINLALAAFMILIIEETAMRPVEIPSARVIGNNLIIKSAKRRIGDPTERRLPLDMFPEKFVKTLPEMLALFPSSSQHEFDSMRNKLAETVARACAKNKIARLSLYSFRHLRISIWVESGALDEVVAVLSGHASNLTAKRHYAQKVKGGWGPARVNLPNLTSFDYTADQEEVSMQTDKPFRSRFR